MAKKSKQTVDYRPTMSQFKNCHLCRHIQLHGKALATCALVQGTVDRVHVCDLFKRK